ncbi:MAG: 4-hydroxybenzoate octaprenyltransferase [Gammaproteobacteria bacterium]|nr:4-hydroxybenzoate octaprenyltransferase [Gammaproteobacteria bacterium]
MTIEKLKNFCYLARLHKPAGLFLIWPMLWALWLAGEGHPNGEIVIIFILGAIIMRSAGCVINDISDRRFDAHVSRTCQRPLVTKKISTKEAFCFFAILLSCAFSLVLYLNQFTIMLAFAGVIFAVIYPLMKRFTYLPQLGLGVAFSWGVPMAFAAQNNIILVNDWIVFFAAVIWPVIYDTFYAMIDRPEDLKIGVKSTAILFGAHDKTIIAMLQILFLGVLGKVGYLFHLHVFYYLGLVIVSVLFIYQQLLIRSNNTNNYYKAFVSNHWVGLVIFLGIVTNYCFY